MSSVNFKELSDKCKWFEKNFSLEQMIPELPVVLRFDGNNFSKWTKSLDKPFDTNFIKCMGELTKFLMGETGASVGYHQSDEVTLLLFPGKTGFSYHEGKKQKILSKLTSKASIKFNDLVRENIGDKSIAIFDCRIYQVPNASWAYKQIFWRQMDGIRNSRQMLAHYHLGHKSIENMSTKKMVEKLEIEEGVFWDLLYDEIKYGGIYCQTKTTSAFTPEEIESLPPKHNYFNNPNMVIERNLITKSLVKNITELDIDRLERVFVPRIILDGIGETLIEHVILFRNKLHGYSSQLSLGEPLGDSLVSDFKYWGGISGVLGLPELSGLTGDDETDIKNAKAFISQLELMLLYPNLTTCS